MKRFIVYTFCIICSLNYGVFSQEIVSLRGTVYEKGTKNVVPDMAIFIPYSSVGTTSAEDGSFELKKVPIGRHEIHFRHLAYELYILDYDTENAKNQILTINIEPLTIIFDEVTLSADPSKRNSYLKIFNEFCLGDVYQTKNYLLNPDALFFYSDGNILRCKSKEKLLIINKQLGFQITFFLDNFNYSNSYTIDDKTDESYYSFAGSPLYELIEPSNFMQEVNWQKNREAAFEGSLRHFFISSYYDRWQKNGYSIRKIYKSVEAIYHDIGVEWGGEFSNSMEVDSIFDFDLSSSSSRYFYFLPHLDYPDLVQRKKKAEVCELFVKDTILIFHDFYHTESIKDDQQVLFCLENGEIILNHTGQVIDLEGEMRWNLLGNQRNLRNVLPIDYLPEKFANTKSLKRIHD